MQNERQMRLGGLLVAFTISFATTAASPSLAADASLDPGGWRQFKWGMSFQDADALANGQLTVEAKFTEDYRQYLGYEADFHTSMPDGTPIEVTLWFDCAQRGLHGVSLDFGKGAKTKIPDVSDQYGPPDHIQNDGSLEWNFPTTRIHFEMSERYVMYGTTTNEDCPTKPLQNLGY